MASLSVTLDDL